MAPELLEGGTRLAEEVTSIPSAQFSTGAAPRTRAPPERGGSGAAPPAGGRRRRRSTFSGLATIIDQCLHPDPEAPMGFGRRSS